MSVNVIRRIVIAATVIAYTNDLTLENARQGTLHLLKETNVEDFFKGWTNRLARMRGASSALVALRVALDRTDDPQSARFADAIMRKLVDSDGNPFPNPAAALSFLSVKPSGGPPQSMEAQRLGVASFPSGDGSDAPTTKEDAARIAREDAILRADDAGVSSMPSLGTNIEGEAKRIRAKRADAAAKAAKAAIKS